MKIIEVLSQNKLKRSIRYLAVIMILSIASSPIFAAGVAVVVAAGSDIDNLNKNEVRSIFLGKTNKFPDGTIADPVMTHNSSSAHTVFFEKVVEKNETQLTSYWSKRVFSGKGMPPKNLDSDQAVKSYVNNNTGGIGVIDSSSVDNSVKIVLVVD